MFCQIGNKRIYGTFAFLILFIRGLPRLPNSQTITCSGRSKWSIRSSTLWHLHGSWYSSTPGMQIWTLRWCFLADGTVCVVCLVAWSGILNALCNSCILCSSWCSLLAWWHLLFSVWYPCTWWSLWTVVAVMCVCGFLVVRTLTGSACSWTWKMSRRGTYEMSWFSFVKCYCVCDWVRRTER